MPTGAEHEIRRRIAASGAITFAEFMEVALYHRGGYYASRGPIGAGGDYFTSPVVHPAFGALVSVQLHTMWQTLGQPDPFWVIEAGAGDGVLASDIVDFASRQFPLFSEAIRYVAVDRLSPVDASRMSRGVEWIQSVGIPVGGIVGCVVANELIDAMTVHRFEITACGPCEVYVSLDSEGRFIELLDESSTKLIAGCVESIGRELRYGFRGEVNAGVLPWVAAVAEGLERGFVLTLDYGYEVEELYSDARSGGTLQTYYRHTDSGSPYQRVGRQDMTAHVDFTALIDEGRSVGLRPVFLATQGEFLLSLGYALMEDSLQAAAIGSAERRLNARAMRRLVDPEGLGKFKVLVQDKDSGISRASDLVPCADSVTGLTVPLPTKFHMPTESFGQTTTSE